ncbi:MAG: hypothetical protein HJJLKODD_01223 [Phycisphaerae bacterium]|nr:hypothetical protein [Phycisphaerae bacterium]
MADRVLMLITLLYLVLSSWGAHWGLDHAQRQDYLFPAGSGWSPQKVAQLRHQPATLPAAGADVDPNPTTQRDALTQLNTTDRDIAEIYARYLLYSTQPDEMITFRAIARMHPSTGQFDPQMYQYGGLFIYPIAAAAQLAGWVGLVQLGDTDFFLQHPGEFAKLYLVGRYYVIFWGMIGLWVIYALGRQLHSDRAGLLAALLFTLLPITVALSHESKPHLPGAVLMLWASYSAISYYHSCAPRHRLLLAIFCGLALSMVLSSLWIFVLIPLAEFFTQRDASLRENLLASGWMILLGLGVYALTNPYVAINAVTAPELLRSNVGNSTAMYQIADLSAGLHNALQLLMAGSSPVLAIAGVVLLVSWWAYDWRQTLLLTVPALICLAQFVALAAGKPGEYGRFALFPNCMLMLWVAVGTMRFLAPRWYQGLFFSLAAATALAMPTLPYLQQFHTAVTTRSGYPFQRTAGFSRHGDVTQDSPNSIGLLRQPAPYNLPPLDFNRWAIYLLPPDVAQWPVSRGGWPEYLVVPINGTEGVTLGPILDDGFYQLDYQVQQSVPVDLTPLTWANRPLIVLKKSRR